MVAVNIPAGVMEGNYMTLRGHGDAGIRSAPAGDLIGVVSEKPHPIFERHGTDILSTLPVHPHQAVLGAKVEVPTLTGHLDLSRPLVLNRRFIAS
jgi:molecular chaperone DnaJ